MNAVSEHPSLLQPTLQQVRKSFDQELSVQWTYLSPIGRPCFNRNLLLDLLSHYDNLESTGCSTLENGSRHEVHFDVAASDIEGVFNLGGDLSLFRDLIAKRDASELMAYAKLCIENVWNRLRCYGRDVVTIALVQGKALGGGFEAALSSQVLVAERSAQFGLPEVLFNLFPGMGAYSILSRRLGQREAEKMIMSGRTYSAEQMHALGLVDVLAEDGQGELAVLEYLRTHQRRSNAMASVLKCRQLCNPVTHEELLAVADQWVQAALRLQPRDLKMMDRLVQSQDRLERAKTDQFNPGLAVALA
jgi:DSF synthase